MGIRPYGLSQMQDGHFFLKLGDILLTRNPKGKFNPAYQKAMRRSSVTSDIRSLNFIPTHAALAMGGGYVIHSELKTDLDRRVDYGSIIDLIKKSRKVGIQQALQNASDDRAAESIRAIAGAGVDCAPLKALFDGKKADDIWLIRHPELTLSNDLMASIYQRALFHLDKPYNPFIEFFDGAGVSAFCSQLVYEILKEAGLSLPERPANRVLPLDFLIWAMKFKWQLVPGSTVLAAFERDRVEDLHQDFFSVNVELNRYAVQRLKQSHATVAAVNELTRMVAELIDTVDDVAVTPMDLVRLGLPATGHTVEGVIRAADYVYRSLMKAAHLPGCPDPQRAAPLVVGIESPSLLHWSLREPDASPSNDDPSLTLACHFLAHTDAMLRNFTGALDAAIALLEEYLRTPSCQKPEDVLLSDPFKILLFTGDYFEWEANKENLDAESGAIKKRLDSISAEFQAYSKVIFDYNSGADGVPSLHDQAIEASDTLRILSICTGHYLLAFDFAEAVAWVKLADTLGGFDAAVENLLSHDPVHLLEFLRDIKNGVPNTRRNAMSIQKLLEA
ncbi:hypothetical protein AA0473_1851 [Acetobacter orleanensis NRIC 0473]|nr:hypothetical protein AA0473_1851 [Acetobacter orleanensis NRIC 0473]